MFCINVLHRFLSSMSRSGALGGGPVDRGVWRGRTQTWPAQGNIGTTRTNKNGAAEPLWRPLWHGGALAATRKLRRWRLKQRGQRHQGDGKTVTAAVARTAQEQPREAERTLNEHSDTERHGRSASIPWGNRTTMPANKSKVPRKARQYYAPNWLSCWTRFAQPLRARR